MKEKILSLLKRHKKEIGEVMAAAKGDNKDFFKGSLDEAEILENEIMGMVDPMDRVIPVRAKHTVGTSQSYSIPRPEGEEEMIKKELALMIGKELESKMTFTKTQTHFYEHEYEATIKIFI